MKNKINTSIFIDRAKKIHGDTYSYSKTQYIKMYSVIEIICRKHGSFFQYPYVHLKGSGCSKCGYVVSGNKQSSSAAKQFINKLKILHPNLKLLSSYIKNNVKVIVEDELGIKYNVLPSNLLKKAKPALLSALNIQEAFKIKSVSLYGNKYDYSKSIYTKTNNRLIITCPKHGDFEQTPHNHWTGSECPKCTISTYNKIGWVEFCKNKKYINPKVYIIRCYNNEESFIKIGITTTSVYKRFLSNLPYSYEVLKEIKGSADFVWDKEKELHKKFKKYKYNPLLSFNGKTECFSDDILKYI